MNHIIGAEQNGFVPGRFIGENNMLMHEIIQHLEEKDDKGIKTKGGALLFLDFEKAFDRVDHDFMFKVLEKLAFPTEFISWIQLLYAEATSQVRINNITSKKIIRERK